MVKLIASVPKLIVSYIALIICIQIDAASSYQSEPWSETACPVIHKICDLNGDLQNPIPPFSNCSIKINIFFIGLCENVISRYK